MPPMRGNIIMAKHLIHVLSGLLLITSSALSADALITVQSKGRYPDYSWKDYPTRTLSGLSGYDQSRTGEPYETAFAQKFGSVKAWADQTTDMFRGLGFNGS
jgi:hypothetical protein